jgi:mRNA interferase MazF
MMKKILRSEIWQVRFDPTEGSEIGKSRPAVVLQNDIGNRYAKTTIVAAITGRIKGLPTLVEVAPTRANGLRRPCAVNLSHVRTVSQSRLVGRIGRLEDEYLPKIELASLISLGFK